MQKLIEFLLMNKVFQELLLLLEGKTAGLGMQQRRDSQWPQVSTGLHGRHVQLFLDHTCRFS